MNQRDELIRHLASAIERLPETAQLVLALRYDEGLTFRELGAVLDLSEDEVRRLRDEALARLTGGVHR